MVVYVRRRARLRGRKAHTPTQLEVNTVRASREYRAADDEGPGDARLPHERDESSDDAPEQTRGVMRQAADDVAAGRADTEARSAAVDHYRRNVEGKARGRG